MKLHEYLKAKREAANLSQTDVSKRLGYTSAQFVSNWERGLCWPPYESLNVLVKLYKLNPEDLIQRILKEEENTIRIAMKQSAKVLPFKKVA